MTDYAGGEGPAIILVHPQLGENIGTAARAMWNFGLRDLRLVRPRDGWPNPKARSAASGADIVIDNARLFDTVEEAVADVRYLLATTARVREMVKPVLTPHAAAAELRRRAGQGEGAGILFGPERTGLDNDAVTLAHAIIRVPTNPDYSSINVAQSVLLVGYEWFTAVDESPERSISHPHTRLATQAELVGLFDHLERELEDAGFLYPPEKRPAMVRNIRNIFQRTALTEQDVRTLRGIVATLVHPKPGTPRNPAKKARNS